MFTDAEYKAFTEADQASYFRQFRYNGTELQLKPHVNTLDSISDRNQPVPGLFFEKIQVLIGKFEQNELGLPDVAFLTGAEWEVSKDGTNWVSTFISKPPREKPFLYDCEFYKLIAAQNLTVTYEQGQGTYATVEGNQVEDTATATFTAVVSQQQRPRDLNLPGTPASAIYVEGYHVVPKLAPAVNKQQRFSATLNGVAGEFVMVPVVQPPSGIVGGSGDLIKGFFVVKGLG